MKLYIVKYSGPFAFIKPWTAVRDGETNSQQFLTPSMIEGIRQKLEVKEIQRHKLTYSAIDQQQEKTMAKAWKKKSKGFIKEVSILTRGVLLNPQLLLAFKDQQEAERASKQHICLARNEDLLLPGSMIYEYEEQEFNELDGFELRFEKNEQSFLVGYNRFDNFKPMYGWLEISGNPIQKPDYEQL